MPNSARRLAAGFVLPTTMLVTTLLTVMLTAAFILVSAEFRTTDNSMASTHALALAQGGLQTYFSANRTIGSGVTYDSVRYPVPYGYADVVARRLRPPVGGSLGLWVVRASGYSTEGRLGGQTQGKRVVAQLAQLNPGVLPTVATLVSANGTQMLATGSNPISGVDFGVNVSPCVTPGGSASDTFGLATFPGLGGYDGGSGNGPGGEGTGGMNTLASASAVLDSTHIDWASLLAGNFVPDINVAAMGWPAPGPLTFPVVYVEGNAIIPASPSPFGSYPRRGLLVVTGNLFMSNGAHWDGIILVGGRIDTLPGNMNASYSLHGMVVTGLNIITGDSVGPNRVVRVASSTGTRAIQWHYCNVRNSISSLSAMVPIRNAWVDTWTTY